MPSLFDSQMVVGASLLLETSGEPVTLTPKGEQPISIPLALVSYEETVEKNSGEVRSKVRQRLISIPNQSQAVLLDATITYQGTEYAVVGIDSKTGQFTICKCERSTRGERARA